MDRYIGHYNITEKTLKMVLTLSLLMTTYETFVDRVDQDLIAQNMQSDLLSTLSTILF